MPPTGWFPEATSLHVLVRQDDLQEGDRIEILERRARLLKPRLSEMTLTPLSRIVWCERSIRMTAELASDFMDWRSDGIVGSPNWVAVDQDHRKTWMLTRKGEWVWLVIKLDPTELWKGDNRRVLTVDLWQATPKMFAAAGYNLDHIASSLAIVAKHWRDRRRDALQTADDLVSQIEAEEALMIAWSVVRQGRS